ncbi:hypothetical protein STEG23_032872, partial [Scotinomys teguina]
TSFIADLFIPECDWPESRHNCRLISVPDTSVHTAYVLISLMFLKFYFLLLYTI